MRFVCDSCRAQYMISDDKVGAKGVKVRCKKCGFQISVRRPEAVADTADLDRTQVVSNPLAAVEASGGGGGLSEGSLFEGATEDEIGAVFDQVLSSGPHPMPSGSKAEGEEAEDGEPLHSTRVLDVATMQRLADESARSEAAAQGAVSAEWYVAIDEKQVGPLDLEQVRDHWERGEIGPDSLCWRAGLPDWLPLSDVAELQRHLAPRPAKPVIVAPAAVTPAAAPAPVESAFAAGGTSKPSAAPAGEGGWKPSAASALASLVKEEMAALSKPAPKPAAPEPAAAPVPGLLDVPPPEATPSVGVRPAAPVAAAMPQAPAPGYPVQPGYAPPYPAQPGYAPSPYGAPPVLAQQPVKSSRGLMLGIAAGVLVVAGALAGVVLVPKLTAQPEPVAVAQPPAPAPQAAAPAPAPAAQPTTAPSAPAVAQTQPASGTATPPAAAPAVASAPEPKPAAVAEAPLKPAALPEAKLKTEPVREETARRERRTERPAARDTRRDEPAPQVAERESPKSDDPFEDIFGAPKASAKKAEPKREERAAVYVPPAPGSGDVQETLGQSDIMQVVLANKASIVKCVQQQKASDPSLSGKLVMRWTVQTSGKVSGVSCQSPEFKDTQMASCVAGLIKTWAFPRHKRQGDPINFPFTF